MTLMMRLLTVLTFSLLVLPWLNPFAPGPSPAVGPWLVSMACFAGAVLLFVLQGRSRENSSAAAANSRRISRQRLLSVSLLAAGAVSGALALIQYFDLGAPFAPWINATEPGQAFANLRQRNQFASLTNLALAVVLAWAMRRGDEKVMGRVGVLALGAATLLAVGNAASASRTGVVQIVLLCVLFGLWGGCRAFWVRLVLITAITAYVAAAIGLPYAAGFDWATHGLFARLQAGDAPCSSRITLWSNVLHLIGQKPWLGWGWGELDYAHFITLYEGPRFCDILDNAHNLPLHLAVELGVPVALLVCGGFAWWVIRQKPWAERDTDRQMAWAMLAIILLHSMLEYPLWYGPFQIALGLCLVILWQRQEDNVSTQNELNQESNSAKSHINRALAAMFFIVSTGGLAAVLYASWDYHRVSQIYLQPESRHAAYQNDTLVQAKKSWLFADQALFAELILTPLSPATAKWTHASAGHLLHFSPEPRVIQKLIESAVMLGEDAQAVAYLARFKAAFPKEHAAWAKAI